MQTLRNESNDTEKHEKVIKTQYHLNSLERTFLLCVCVCVCVYPSSSLGWRYGMNGNSGLCRQTN